jgi:hypothetical protein
MGRRGSPGLGVAIALAWAVPATGYMSAGDLFEFQGTVAYSLEAWVKPMPTTNDQDVMSRNEGQGNTAQGYFMFVESAPQPFTDFSRYDGALNRAIARSTRSPTNEALS